VGILGGAALFGSEEAVYALGLRVDVGSVVEAFDAGAAELLSGDERAELEFSLAINPKAHPTIAGTGGVRKARWSRAGMGKRLMHAELVVLIGMYAKNVQENLTNEEKKQIRGLSKRSGIAIADTDSACPGGGGCAEHSRAGGTFAGGVCGAFWI